MKLKKILAAIAACSMAIAMVGMTASAESVEAEEEEIADEEIVDEEIPAEEEEEIPAEEEEVPAEEEEVPAEEEAPVENPTTGNSPIALAVIPVALAAAAVVAKKIK